MANTRTIQSPGVEIREIDLSTRLNAPNGTSFLVTGFAPQGPTYEILNVASVADFETIYGTPTNAAERYFYYSVRQLFTGGTNAVVNVARLPYGAEAGEGFSSKYSALVFPVVAASATDATAPVANGTALSAAGAYYLTQPTLVELTDDQYNLVLQGGLQWATAAASAAPVFTGFTELSAAGLIVLNKAKTTINEKFEGFYFNLADNANLNPSTDFDAALTIDTIAAQTAATSAYTAVPNTRYQFQLSATATANVGSVSQDIENIPSFNIAGTAYQDTAIFSLFKVRVSPFSPTALTLEYVLQEGYTGSFYSDRKIQDPNGGQPQSYFINTLVNNTSPNLTIFVNPNIADNTSWLDSNGNANKAIRVLRSTSSIFNTASGGGHAAANNLYALGVYSPTLGTENQKVVGNVSTKVDKILNLAQNPDTLSLDVVIDGGISTIAAAGSAAFDDTYWSGSLKTNVQALTSSTGNAVSNDTVNAWVGITTKFDNFARNERKDLVFISDPLRWVFVQGQNFKTLDDKSKNFSQNIYWPLRNLYSNLNSSYSTTYGNWARTTDQYTNKNVWLPFSGFAAAAFSRNDAIAYPWGAPAGLNRGTITGINDLGVNPQQKQRDLLYKVSVNPVVFFPNEGYTIMGQKTLLKAPSAFDRLNVRRLFLYLEKSVFNTAKFFVFEPNTTFTRSRLVNTITPVFDLAKNTQGLFDYLIVCNTTNNTPELIDDNTLVVDIYIKPVRTAEFILVNFYCTRTSQNFQELIS